jgi:nitrogen PTS system EIIA component
MKKMSGIRYFQAGTVVGGLKSKDKYSAIRELVQKAPIFSSLKDPCRIEQAAIEREKILTTGLGRGVAIAHGKTSCVEETVILLGISRHGIDFESMDGEPVHLLFLIANPPEKTDEYLLALSTLTCVMRNQTFLASLRCADTAHTAQKLMADRFAAAWRTRCQN